MKMFVFIALFCMIIGLMVYPELNRKYSSVCDVDWRGSIRDDTFEIAKNNLANAQAAGCGKLRIRLMSSGGSVFHTLALLFEMRKAKQHGMILEIHGRGIVASGATLVLGYGTPGYRFIQADAFTVVHGLQVPTLYGSSCAGIVNPPKSDDDRVINSLVGILASEYSYITGKSRDEVMAWIKCGSSITGDGRSLVALGLADTVE